MDDELLLEFINLIKDEKKDDIKMSNLVTANTKLVDENAIMKKELDKCYRRIDNAVEYIDQLEKKTIEIKKIYKIITGDEEV